VAELVKEPVRAESPGRGRWAQLVWGDLAGRRRRQEALSCCGVGFEQCEHLGDQPGRLAQGFEIGPPLTFRQLAGPLEELYHVLPGILSGFVHARRSVSGGVAATDPLAC
jgi:hypothetical protein